MIRAVVFDCFGVLVGQGFDATWRRAGGDPDHDRVFIQDMLGATNVGHITIDHMTAMACQKLGITQTEWFDAIAQTEQPDQQLLDFIATELKPHYGVAVLSNANVGTLERVLTDSQRSVFDALVVSAEVGCVKPQPEIYQLVAERLGVAPEECVFTDDSQAYCDGAAAVGMKTVLFRDREQFQRDLAVQLNHS
jgi:HAD superfamily hydrolase (TIGR01509 family)